MTAGEDTAVVVVDLRLEGEVDAALRAGEEEGVVFFLGVVVDAAADGDLFLESRDFLEEEEGVAGGSLFLPLSSTTCSSSFSWVTGEVGEAGLEGAAVPEAVVVAFVALA